MRQHESVGRNRASAARSSARAIGWPIDAEQHRARSICAIVDLAVRSGVSGALSSLASGPCEKAFARAGPTLHRADPRLASASAPTRQAVGSVAESAARSRPTASSHPRTIRFIGHSAGCRKSQVRCNPRPLGRAVLKCLTRVSCDAARTCAGHQNLDRNRHPRGRILVGPPNVRVPPVDAIYASSDKAVLFRCASALGRTVRSARTPVPKRRQADRQIDNRRCSFRIAGRRDRNAIIADWLRSGAERLSSDVIAILPASIPGDCAQPAWYMSPLAAIA